MTSSPLPQSERNYFTEREKLTCRNHNHTYPDALVQTIQAEEYLVIHLNDPTPEKNIADDLCFDHSQK